MWWISVAQALRDNGWTVFNRQLRIQTRPRPHFLAVSVADNNRAKRIQIYCRRPNRGGRLGALQVDAIARTASKLPRWDAFVVSDRGFTLRAFDRAEAFNGTSKPRIRLMSIEESVASLAAREVEARPRDEIVTYHADIVLVGAVTPEILEKLARSRHALEAALRQSNPRFLEELVAENWKAQGYDVEIVGRLNAGGPDVIATKRDSFIPLKILSSCKWRSPGSAVKKVDVAELLSWVEMIYPANAGLLATNTRLQKGALGLVYRFHRIHALERNGLVDWTLELWGTKKHGAG